MTIIRNILAALCLAGFGVYVLHAYPTGYAGLGVGGIAILGALGIAFPTQMDDGFGHVKGWLVLLIPVVKGALPGGSRKDDPPAEIELPPPSDK